MIWVKIDVGIRRNPKVRALKDSDQLHYPGDVVQLRAAIQKWWDAVGGI